MKEYLFVYGLFRDSAKSLLGEIVFCGKSSVSGKIYKVNEFYPGFKSDTLGEVWGDVYLIDSSVLPLLDEFEGYEYSRVRIRTSSDLDCWIYEYKLDIKDHTEIKCGDWMLR